MFWSTVLAMPANNCVNVSSSLNKVVAPFIDVSMSFDVENMLQSTGMKAFTAAFIVADAQGQPSWAGTVPLDSNLMLDKIENLRCKGGEVIVSFGGAVNQELAIVTNSVNELEQKYSRVISKYKLKWIDFDIEGAGLKNVEANKRRNEAIKLIQQKNPNLITSFTLPVLPTGLTDDGLNFLVAAKAAGVRVDVVNIMAMDYGLPGAGKNMAISAMQAAQATNLQVQGIKLNSKIGVTPMIGQNDVKDEVFSLDDARQLVQWAKQQDFIRWLSFWSGNRDSGTFSSQLFLSSQVKQKPFEFSQIFTAFQ